MTSTIYGGRNFLRDRLLALCFSVSSFCFVMEFRTRPAEAHGPLQGSEFPRLTHDLQTTVGMFSRRAYRRGAAGTECSAGI
jgi:hypothetical protein